MLASLNIISWNVLNKFAMLLHLNRRTEGRVKSTYFDECSEGLPLATAKARALPKQHQLEIHTFWLDIDLLP